MTDDERKLLRINHQKPFAGRNDFGQGKESGCCPHCGAPPEVYWYAGRSKKCGRCGYAGLGEKLFMSARWALRRGIEVTEKHITTALKYGITVYGDPDK
jgi:hypothetical protein